MRARTLAGKATPVFQGAAFSAASAAPGLLARASNDGEVVRGQRLQAHSTTDGPGRYRHRRRTQSPPGHREERAEKPCSPHRRCLVCQEAVGEVGVGQRERLAPHRNPARPAGQRHRLVRGGDEVPAAPSLPTLAAASRRPPTRHLSPLTDRPPPHMLAESYTRS
jgi:hypothetical protein